MYKLSLTINKMINYIFNKFKYKKIINVTFIYWFYIRFKSELTRTFPVDL